MRYGTWNIDFNLDTHEGTTPLLTQGVFHVSATKIAGYIPANEDISLLGQWGIAEISADAFFALALVVNPLVTMADGLLVIPMSDRAG